MLRRVLGVGTQLIVAATVLAGCGQSDNSQPVAKETDTLSAASVRERLSEAGFSYLGVAEGVRFAPENARPDVSMLVRNGDLSAVVSVFESTVSAEAVEGTYVAKSGLRVRPPASVELLGEERVRNVAIAGFGDPGTDAERRFRLIASALN